MARPHLVPAETWRVFRLWASQATHTCSSHSRSPPDSARPGSFLSLPTNGKRGYCSLTNPWLCHLLSSHSSLMQDKDTWGLKTTPGGRKAKYGGICLPMRKWKSRVVRELAWSHEEQQLELRRPWLGVYESPFICFNPFWSVDCLNLWLWTTSQSLLCVFVSPKGNLKTSQVVRKL